MTNETTTNTKSIIAYCSLKQYGRILATAAAMDAKCPWLKQQEFFHEIAQVSDHGVKLTLRTAFTSVLLPPQFHQQA